MHFYAFWGYSYSYYWHFNQTGIVHSKWIPVFHDGFIAAVNLYSDMYCTCFLFMHNTTYVFGLYWIYLNSLKFIEIRNFH